MKNRTITKEVGKGDEQFREKNQRTKKHREGKPGFPAQSQTKSAGWSQQFLVIIRLTTTTRAVIISSGSCHHTH